MSSKVSRVRPHRRDIALPKIAAIHRRIGFANQIEDRRQRLGRIQIVFEALLETPAAPCSAPSPRAEAPSGNLPRVKARGKIPQPFDRAGRLLQSLLREIELTAIRDRGEQKA